MSTNEVTLFGVLSADADLRKSQTGIPWALLKVKTFNWVRDPVTKKPAALATEHEVHCFDELLVKPLAGLGKKGYWITIRGHLAYNEGRQAYVTVPPRGGMATVSAYFGDRIRPDMPFRTLLAEAVAGFREPDTSGIDALHAHASKNTGTATSQATLAPCQRSLPTNLLSPSGVTAATASSSTPTATSRPPGLRSLPAWRGAPVRPSSASDGDGIPF